MDSKKEKNRLSDIVLERVGLTGNLLSDPVFPSPEPVTRVPGHERPVGAGKVTGPEEYKRRFLVPAPKAAEWKTAYIDGRLHRRIAMLVRAAGCGSISGFIIRLLELHMEEHREDIAALHRKLSILTGASRNGKVTLEGFINHLVSRHLEEYRETVEMILEESLPGRS